MQSRASGWKKEGERNGKKNKRETTTERGRMVKTGGKKREDRGSLFLSLNGRGEDDDGREVRSKMERE